MRRCEVDLPVPSTIPLGEQARLGIEGGRHLVSAEAAALRDRVVQGLARCVQLGSPFPDQAQPFRTTSLAEP